ncbi:MAG: InlB B-repeat-containing protein [Lachnospiraceae bacterium]|nr:InlB B-repeat-containing protein [Lachnospiraceae bacterium]
MERLKKEGKRLLSLLVVIAIIVVSVSQERLTVHAAEIGEYSMEFDASEEDEAEQFIPESVEIEETEQLVLETIQAKEIEIEESSMTKDRMMSEPIAATEETSFTETEETTLMQGVESETEMEEMEETEETEVLQNESESTSLDTQLVAIHFSGDNVTIKDFDGNIIEHELLVAKGTKAVVFSVEPSEGYVVKSVKADEENFQVSFKEGTSANQYIASPDDRENGYVGDKWIHIETVPAENHTMHIFYPSALVSDCMEDVIIANGDVWREDCPEDMTVSNASDIGVYIKIGKTQGSAIWIPEISVTFFNEDNIGYTKTLSYQRDINSMNTKEKELLQQGYYIFHLGQRYNIFSISIDLNECYQVQTVTTGFPGNVRIFNYIPDGYDAQGNEKWRKEEIKDTFVTERNKATFLQAEWEDTSDHAYKWCKLNVLSDWKTSIKNITMEGIEGEVQEIFISEETTIEFVLNPHTISFGYYIGDLTDISVGSGAKLSEDQRTIEVYGGDNVSLNFSLIDGLQLNKVIDRSGAKWSVQEKDGKYTITLNDMEALYNIKEIGISVLDLQDRFSLSDARAGCQITSYKFKNIKSGIPVYTGEAIEVETMTLSAITPNRENGSGSRTVTLSMDKDFTVSYVNNINAGEARVLLTAMPDSYDFRGSIAYSFTIHKAEALQRQEKTLQVETGNQQYTHQINLSELFQIKQPNGQELIPLGYRIEYCDKGDVLIPDKDPLLKGNILTYTIRDGADKNSPMADLSVAAFFDNYQDCELIIHIQAVQKQKMTLGGTVTVSDKEYDGKGVSLNADGLRILSIEGTNDSISEKLLNQIKETLDYRYTGINGTVYTSNNAPTDVGTYKVEAKVSEDNPDFKSEYMDVGTFRISQRKVSVIADDVKLYLQDTIPTQYSYHTDGLAKGDVVSTKPLVSCNIQSADVLTEYPVNVDVAVVKIANATGKDVTANYVIAGQEGKLAVREPEQGSYSVIYTWVDPLDPLNTQKDIRRSGNESGKLIKKPIDPTADGYIFLGWYTDETSDREWDFDTDVIQGNLTLYAGWSKHAVESGGMALCVQEILPQTYTGKAIKPTVVVYAADGKIRLKYKTDYTITYKNNINADTKAFPVEVPQGGIGETLGDTTQGFNSALPYVIIQGKGNYTGTVYVNFHIRPADIATVQTNASEYVLKYTDQFEENPGKYGTVVTQFKYKKKGLGYNKDYTLAVQKVDGESATVPLNAKGQLPLTAGAYQVTIAGKNNFTGEITKNVYVADKTRLFKNAKVTCKAVISNATKEKLEAGIQPENLVVNMNGIVLTEADYTVECTNNHAIGIATVNVRPKGSDYIGSKSITFKINGTDFKESTIQMSGWQDEMPYTGKALTQNNVVLKTNDGRVLTYGEDYFISYKNNIKKGAAQMVFTANPASGYSGSFSKKFKIAPMDLEAAINEGMISVNGAEKTASGWKLLESVPYQKRGVEPKDKVSLQLTISDTVLRFGKDMDYTVKYTNNKTVSDGTAYMTLKGIGNYTGSIDIYFDITKASLFRSYQEGRVTITTASIKVSYPYGRHYEDYGDGYGEWIEDSLKDPDRKFEPAITIKDGNAALKKDVDFTVEYIGNTRSDLEGGDVLVAVIKGIGAYGNDDDEIELNVSVNRSVLSAAKVEVTYENAFSYTGEQIMPEVEEVRYKTFNGYGREDDEDYEPPEWETLKQDEDYRIEYTKNIAKGTGTIKIVGIGGYTGSVSKSFKINSKAIYNKISD